MPSQTTHPDTTQVIQNVGSLANRQNKQRRGPSGYSPLPPGKRDISVPAGKRDSLQGGSSVAFTIQGQNSSPFSSRNNSHSADITQRVNYTMSATQRQSINTPTAALGRGSRSTPAPGGTSQTDSTRRVVSSPASGIAGIPTSLSGLEYLPTSIPNPEACRTITNPLWTWATERNQRQIQLQLQLQAVSTPRSMVSDSHRIHWLGHSDMIRLIFATGRLLVLYMWNRWLFMFASDLDTVSHATQPVVKALVEAPHWQIIETYWNTAMQ